jgi:hypothetical protein
MKTQRGSCLVQSPLFRRTVAGVVLLLLASVLFHGHSQVPPEIAPEVRDKNVMQIKLHYAQSALEAITTANYSLLATNAEQLRKITQQVSWRVRHAPEYERLTADFRRAADALAIAAKNENVDEATVAYFQMTVSCVTCHKYLRGRAVALFPEPQHATQRGLVNR